jgi:hypothetical protein
MSNPGDRKSGWHFPADLTVLLGTNLVVLPLALLGGWFAMHLYDAKNRGDVSPLWLSVAFALCGTVLLFSARLPLYRQRRFLVFGPRELDEKHRRLYWWAYGFMGVSVFLMLLLLFILG